MVFSIAVTTLVTTIFFTSNRVQRLIKCHTQRIQLMSLANKAYTSKEKVVSEGISSSGESSDNNHKITVSGLFIHPIKSLRPVSVNSTKFTNLGLEGDRTLMIVRPYYSSHSSLSSSGKPQPSHRFLTQRQCPALATIDVVSELLAMCRNVEIPTLEMV